MHDIDKTISIKKENVDNIKNNFTVIDLKNVNSTMKKILPLLVCKYRYKKHKKHYKEDKYLNIIIDEAHNILSEISSIESEIWKDYRLETFEEIIKEGRKFGIFITLASQRPMDISKTLISQAHNYFIHKLVNQQDLQAVKNSISYIDKISEEYIPNLPVGTCIFSGATTPMPILIKVDKLENDKSPRSETIKNIRHCKRGFSAILINSTIYTMSVLLFNLLQQSQPPPLSTHKAHKQSYLYYYLSSQLSSSTSSLMVLFLPR